MTVRAALPCAVLQCTLTQNLFSMFQVSELQSRIEPECQGRMVLAFIAVLKVLLLLFAHMFNLLIVQHITAFNLEQLKSFCTNILFSQHKMNLQALGPDFSF